MTIPEILFVVGFLVATAVLVLIIILLLANRGAYFTTIAQGTTVFISRGGSLHRILSNVGSFKISDAEDLDGRRWLIRGKKDKKNSEWLESFFHGSLFGTKWFQKWLWKMFGVRFISVFWPHTHVHTFDIRSRKRLLEGADVKPGTPLRDRVVDSTEPDGGKTTTMVNSLLFLVPRPVYLEGVQLAGDNSRVNLLLLLIFQQVTPSLPVYYFKGDFFTQLDAAVETVMVDFFATHRVAVYKKKEGELEERFARDIYEPPHQYEPPQKKEGESNEEHKKREKDCEEGHKKNEEEYEKYESAPLTYSHWLKLTKSGQDSPMEKHLSQINLSSRYIHDLEEVAKEAEKAKDTKLQSQLNELITYAKNLTRGQPAELSEAVKEAIPSGIIPRFGFALKSFRLVDWTPHESTVDLAKALRAKETEFHLAQGVRRKAEGEGDAIKARAVGESRRYEKLVTPLIDKGVTPDVAADVVKTDLRTGNIRDSKVTTYIEGGEGPARASVMVPAASTSKPSTE